MIGPSARSAFVEAGGCRVSAQHAGRHDLAEDSGHSGEEIGDAIAWAIRTLIEDLRKRTTEGDFK